jgi:hypothetical protein
MNFLFLRGRMERHKECKWKSLEECTDMWTHLFAGIVGKEDFGDLLYSGGKRKVEYRSNFTESWLPRLKKPSWIHLPEVIVARGGFKEYVPLLKCFPKAKKVYYGANHGCIPKDGIKYDLILCDSEEQVRKCRKHGLNGKLFFKPAAPQFKPMGLDKKYDVGFSAIWPKDKRKNVAWVHKTIPKDLSMLQMGHACKAPKNVAVKYIAHNRMPRAINKCKVIIAPYTKEDSCPRIISEALACGVPVVALGTCQFWWAMYPVDVLTKECFWKIVRERIKGEKVSMADIYDNELSVEKAAKHLRGLIDEICGI